jgi:hypothetical protein
MDAEVAPTVPDAQSAPNEVHISEAVLEMIVELMPSGDPFDTELFE